MIRVAALAFTLFAAPALRAQAVDVPVPGPSAGGRSQAGEPPSSGAPTPGGSNAPAADEGRGLSIDQGSLSSRAGGNAAGSDRVFGATIGSEISGTIGRPIGSRIGPR